jgi:xylan 1,4-beta-xylosidase
MGEPEYPSRTQVEQLEAASRLVKEPLGFSYENRTVRFDVDLPPHAVAAITLELAPESAAGGSTA